MNIDNYYSKRLVDGTILVFEHNDGYIDEEIGRCENVVEAGILIINHIKKASQKKSEPDNQSMNINEINEVLQAYLADNPETAKRLIAAASKHVENKKRLQALRDRKRELAEAVAGFDEAIDLAQTSINKLKGEVLRIQKERKEAVDEYKKIEAELG